jgi:hypothetical protein
VRKEFLYSIFYYFSQNKSCKKYPDPRCRKVAESWQLIYPNHTDRAQGFAPVQVDFLLFQR